MITTITLNAAIDKQYLIDNLKTGTVMRALKVNNTPGGKGINVSKVARLLGEEVTAAGFIGGANGRYIESSIEKLSITSKMTRISGESRCCLAIIDKDFTQTEILEPGPVVKKEELEIFIKTYSEVIKNSEIVCASGSVPKGVPNDIYNTLITIAKKENKRFILDSSGCYLGLGIEALPYLVKPNKDELAMLTGEACEYEIDIIRQVKKLNKKGIKFVVVSLGSKGLIAGAFNNIYKVSLPKVIAINPVGSGDSMVAGFAAGLMRNYSIEKLLAFASACGSANAMEQATGFVKIQNVNKIMKEIVIEKI
ncbi:1-phosphofructokinase [Clostridium estertheticum]|uniref:1-phosphofructokinase n=1 Tax=Clostridium estertheticum TaxID=238834 RepID=UPI0013E93A2C|nr:1-phosphofructokinase [Clostridium estertheticum]MBZ9686891.1 1-phosphofructokinase [Clostridium estertheticum]